MTLASKTMLLAVMADLLCMSSAWTFTERMDGRVFPRSSLRRFDTARRMSNADTGVSTSTKKDMQSMIDFIQQPIDSTVGDRDGETSTFEPEDLDFVTSIVKAADGRKAEDIKVIYVGDVSTLTSFLVVLSGNSRPQNQAISAAISNEVEEAYELRPGGNGVPEGNAASGWMLLDYGSVMVHVMTPKSRLFYNVEGQWKEKGGKEIDMSHVLVPNTVPGEGDQPMNDGFISEEDDPFWN